MADSKSSEFTSTKWRTFASMYLGYTLIVLNRKSFSFALPSIMHEGRLDKGDLGLIASSQNLAYTGSKFVGGLLADSMSCKQLFAIGLILSGLITAAFSGFDSVWMFAALWFLQGTVQGGAWPACAKILRQWFPPAEFGTWYAVLNTTMNIACSVGPIITAYIVTQLSWRGSMTLYGTCAIGAGAVCFLAIANSPAEVGLEGIAQGDTKKDDKGRRGGGRGRGSWQDMLGSPFMWLLCASYLVVYLGRTAALDWAQLLLIQELGQSEYMGSVFVSSLETGGIVGAVVAGFAADKLVAMSQRSDTRGTPRMTVAIGFVAVNLVALHLLLFTVGEHTSALWTSLVGAALGFGIYGPVSLYGVMAIEAAPTHLSGTSHAIVALSANVGAILAGLPFSFVAKQFEWRGAFLVLEVLLIVILIAKVATRNLEYKMVPIRKKLE